MSANRFASNSKRFFVTGGALAPEAASYVERSADTELLEALLSGELCYVLTARQMGKSSLMVRTAERLRSAGVQVAMLDITAQGQNVTPEQFFRGLLEAVGEALQLEDELQAHWRATPELAPSRRWMSALEKVLIPRLAANGNGAPSVVLCFDEIDAVRSLPFSADELFLSIRHAVERRASEPAWRKLGFCLLGVASPAELVRSPEVTPFNLGRRIELTDFTLKEAAVLGTGLSSRGKGDANRDLIRVLYWTGGHPYLTQRLCESVSERGQTVDEACASLFFSSGDRPQDSNLLFVRDVLLRSTEETGDASLLHLYDRMLSGKRVSESDTDTLSERLRLSGLVRPHRGRLLPRNEIYRRVFDRAWVRRHLPDADVRRQQAAFRLGALRAAGVGGALVGVLTLLLSWALMAQRQANDLGANLRDAQIGSLTGDGSRYATQGDPIRAYLAFARGLALAEGGSGVDPMYRLRTASAQRALPAPIAAWRLTEPPSANIGCESQVSPDGRRVAVLDHSTGVRLFDPATGASVGPLLRHGAEVQSAEFSPDEPFLAVRSNEASFRIWNSDDGTIQATLNHPSPVWEFA